MTTRIDDTPVFAARPDEVEASLYNLWRRAKLHMKTPIRLSLPVRPGIVMILDEREWVCVDERINDLPILAWVNFLSSGRDSLHKPIPCTLNYYHFMAGHLRGKALARMGEALKNRLSAAATPGQEQ